METAIYKYLFPSAYSLVVARGPWASRARGPMGRRRFASETREHSRDHIARCKPWPAQWALPANPRRAPVRASNFPRGGWGGVLNQTSNSINYSVFVSGPSPKPKTIWNVWAQGKPNMLRNVFLSIAIWLYNGAQVCTLLTTLILKHAPKTSPAQVPWQV